MLVAKDLNNHGRFACFMEDNRSFICHITQGRWYMVEMRRDQHYQFLRFVEEEGELFI